MQTSLAGAEQKKHDCSPSILSYSLCNIVIRNLERCQQNILRRTTRVYNKESPLRTQIVRCCYEVPYYYKPQLINWLNTFSCGLHSNAAYIKERHTIVKVRCLCSTFIIYSLMRMQMWKVFKENCATWENNWMHFSCTIYNELHRRSFSISAIKYIARISPFETL